MLVAADSGGLAFSKRRITLSTSGVVPNIARWGAEADTMLAISLHATRDEQAAAGGRFGGDPHPGIPG